MATGDVNLLRDTIAALREKYDPDGRDYLFERAEALTHRDRVKPHRAKPDKSTKMTREKVLKIMEVYRQHPTKSNQWIARRAGGGSGGRVTEVLQGMHDDLLHVDDPKTHRPS